MVDDNVFQLEATIDDGNSVIIKSIMCTSNFSYIIKEVFNFLMDESAYNKNWFLIEISLTEWSEGKEIKANSIIEWEYDDLLGGKYNFLEENFREFIQKDYKQEYNELLMIYKLLNSGGSYSVC